ncbi:hypothetical protein GCM10008983_14980 [Lentibacillus halophilus]|uniref:DUF4367 domain-containing protein n=1 Tax=Lentibacillus halophilus TaxID=295065 RepID=A0ABN0Z8N9_9BACI
MKGKNLKEDMQNIKVPKEKLHQRIESGVRQAESKGKKKRRVPKWILSSVASVVIIGSGVTFGGSYIADAAESLINQIFGSEENLMQAYPDESQEEIDDFDRHLELAKENLTEEEFNDYSELIKERTEIWSRIKEENREPNENEAARLNQIGDLQQSYTDKFALKEVQQQAKFSFTITKPTYIPESYNQIGENYSIENVDEEPVVSLNYSNGEYLFWTQQVNINQKDIMEEMLGDGPYKKSETYSSNGLQFDVVSPKDESASFRGGMRVAVPEKDYKIVMFAEALSKEKMEKVLLSMVEK